MGGEHEAFRAPIKPDFQEREGRNLPFYILFYFFLQCVLSSGVRSFHGFNHLLLVVPSGLFIHGEYVLIAVITWGARFLKAQLSFFFPPSRVIFFLLLRTRKVKRAGNEFQSNDDYSQCFRFSRAPGFHSIRSFRAHCHNYGKE